MNLSEFEVIKGFPKYMINRNGDVWSCCYKKIMKTHLSRDGYVKIELSTKEMSLHRLLAFQYIENDNPEIKIEVNHKNHIRNDNSLENLEWISHLRNVRDLARKRQGSICVLYDKRNSGRKPCWQAKYAIYPDGIDGPRIVKYKSSTNRQVCEDWLENIKKEEEQENVAKKLKAEEK
jgi:hypothetical protein